MQLLIQMTISRTREIRRRLQWPERVDEAAARGECAMTAQTVRPAALLTRRPVAGMLAMPSIGRAKVRVLSSLSGTQGVALDDSRTLREELARGYRVFGALGWGDLGDGHISARDPQRPDCFWMLRYGALFPQATAEDLLLIDRDGNVVQGTGRINLPGFHIHQPILTARPDIISAAHTHTPWGTPFSAEARLIEGAPDPEGRADVVADALGVADGGEPERLL